MVNKTMQKPTKVKITLAAAIILLTVLTVGIPSFLIEYQRYSMDGKNPFKLISKDIGLELSESMEVLEYSYDRKTGYFAVKLRLQKEEVQETERILSERFSGDRVTTDASYYNHLEWWNPDEAEIISSYEGFGSTPFGKSGVKTVPVWVYIVKDENENYFLYLDKYWCSDMRLQ